MAFVCGVIQHRPNSPLDKGAWSWPFGRADFREDEIVAYMPILPRRFTLHIPHSQMIRAVVKPYRITGGAVRLQRTTSAKGDVSIVTVNDNYLRMAELLREKGIHVAEK